MSYCDNEDINNWKNSGIVSEYIRKRQYTNVLDAVSNNNLECLKFLIDNGYDITICMEIFLTYNKCIENEYTDIFEYLLDKYIST